MTTPINMLVNGGKAVARAKTLLVVEDEKVVRLSLTATLEAVGYRVLVAAGGEEAWRLSQAHGEEIDLLITSLMMPGMNGRDLAQRLRQLRPGIKVLFISGYTDEPGTGRLLSETVDICRKPFSPPALLAQVEQLLSAAGTLEEGSAPAASTAAAAAEKVSTIEDDDGGAALEALAKKKGGRAGTRRR